MTERKTLVITEGITDKKLVIRLLSFFVSDKVEVFLLKSNIYQLYDYYEYFGTAYEDLDVRLVLLECCKKTHNKRELAVLNHDYSQILLVFDLDPHTSPIFDQKIKKLMCHFDDSSNFGRLYINYPMLEAFRHINPQCLYCMQPDPNFTQSKFLLSDISHYKKDVGSHGFRTEKDTSVQVISYAIQQHLEKAALLLQKTCRDILNDPSWLVALLELQVKEIKKNKQGYIISTFPLMIPELYPGLYRTFLNGAPMPVGKDSCKEQPKLRKNKLMEGKKLMMVNLMGQRSCNFFAPNLEQANLKDCSLDSRKAAVSLKTNQGRCQAPRFWERNWWSHMEDLPKAAPLGFRWIFCRYRRVRNSSRILDAHDYGYAAWAFLVRA